MIKSVNYTYIEEEVFKNEKQKKFDELFEETYNNEFDSKLEEFNKKLDGYDKTIKKIFSEAKDLLKSRFVFMDSKKVVYDNETVLCIPNTEYYDCISDYTQNTTKNYFKKQHKAAFNFENLIWDFLTYDEHCKILNNNVNYPFKYTANSYYAYVHFCYNKNRNNTNQISYIDEKNNVRSKCTYNSTTWNYPCFILPVYRLDKVNATKLEDKKVFTLWIKNGFIPMNTKYSKDYKFIIDLFNKNKNIKFDLSKNIPKVDRSNIDKSIASNIFDLDIEEIITKVNKNIGTIKLDIKQISKDLLDCDKNRFNFTTYDEKILTDVNRGHWEITTEPTETKITKIELERDLIYRNPLKDVKEGGIVGIDFGTKSTIVAYQQNNTEIRPMRIGTDSIKKKVTDKHYENPTIMEFINLENFINDYKKENGRPNTKWTDLTVSHTAFDSLVGSKSDEYYSYFSEIKQWCGNRDKRVRIKDKLGHTIDLPTFLELNDNDFNPVEIYAYYLGLYINNMKNGIYLNYILSFPVTYEKEIRDKVIKSFESGIKKSLPNEILEDTETMKKFKVINGASEPASYAISALIEYGFNPIDDEKFFYGVFDFGGGTTDFDFGIFRDANGKGEKRFDYVIEHFGAGGDRYLGGENILELLAYEVFKNNSDLLLEKNISFILPPDAKKFDGFEELISESQEARLNTLQIMEKLRPLWEKHENYESLYDKGIIAQNLFKNNGTEETNVELLINLENLEEVIENRIEKGVKNFFESIRMAFNEKDTSKVKKINIFLAGNSSKAVVVKKLFEKYINLQMQEIKSKIMKDENFDEVAITLEKEFESLYEIFPPLGSDEAYTKQEERGIEVLRDRTRPTGKTGVAFGLIEGRNGGKIKVINRNNKEDDEIKFKYYVGENKRKKFKSILLPETNYNKWVEFIDATEEDFEIYYTSLPEASTNTLDILETTRINCQIDKTFDDEDVMVYIRATKPTVIEYVVAKEVDGGIDLMSEVKEINLG